MRATRWHHSGLDAQPRPHFLLLRFADGAPGVARVTVTQQQHRTVTQHFMALQIGAIQSAADTARRRSHSNVPTRAQWPWRPGPILTFPHGPSGPGPPRRLLPCSRTRSLHPQPSQRAHLSSIPSWRKWADTARRRRWPTRGPGVALLAAAQLYRSACN